MKTQPRIIIIGATSTIAEHCARRWLQQSPASLVLVGRDPAKLQRVVDDLKVRSPESDIELKISGFTAATDIQATVDAIAASGNLDIILIAHGSLPSQENCQSALSDCSEALETNGLSPVLFAEAFATHLAKAGRGTLALIGSVAGDRGRKSNYIYGAAKGLVTRYAQGLQHRFAGTAIRIVLIKPGPTDTPMTAHLKAQGAKLASAEQVAAQIVAAIAAGKPVAYVPGKWQLIMLIIRHLPRFIFNKMNI